MSVSNHWRLKAQRYRLEGAQCLKCGEISFPPRSRCPHCRDFGQTLYYPELETVDGGFPVPASQLKRVDHTERIIV
jgi:uncharacterized OB-fold protein